MVDRTNDIGHLGSDINPLKQLHAKRMLKKNGEISHFMESACFVLTGRADLMRDKKTFLAVQLKWSAQVNLSSSSLITEVKLGDALFKLFKVFFKSHCENILN